MTTVFNFDALYEVLDSWPSGQVDGCAKDSIFERLQQVLRLHLEGEKRVVDSDLVSLLRHVMRRQALQTGSPARLRVPVGSSWPNRDRWASFGVRAQNVDTNQHLIEAEPYAPEWLCDSDSPLFEDAFLESEVRLDWRRPIDPFLEDASSFKFYMSPGQREAVRSAFLIPAGETLIVSLPTGSGKSLISQAPVLARGMESGLTLCIVPTTALVLDQARQMTKLLKDRYPRRDVPPLAWHAGLSPEERRAIKSAIRESRQGILYCSPEAVAGALLPALYEAARSGFIAYMVIDEAHLVSQWGDGFRPAFQMLAGIRRGLLKACEGKRFRTILMSATLAADTIETIDALFGPARTIQMIASIYLRPEPQYWIDREFNEDRKIAKLLAAVRHAPRPLIFYVTTRDDARVWLNRLRQQGFVRSECFHGETGDSDKRDIIDRWDKNAIDLIVATSAFGVGIDKRDVRSVFHATVPETLDRFYQEVGRGGRDGRVSTSLLVYTESDRKLADRIGASSLITEDLAFERWSAMLKAAVTLDTMGTLLEVDLDVVPQRLHQQTDYNASWNMRTLIMMARAKMLELESRPPEMIERLEDETEASYELRNEEHWAAYFRKTVVRVLEFAHRDRSTFFELIGRERARSFRATEASNKLRDALLAGDVEVSSLFDDLYRSHVPRRTLIVSPACGGCPAHRRARSVDLNYSEPLADGIGEMDKIDTTIFRERFPHLNIAAPILIPFVDQLDKKLILQVVENLVATFNIREVSISNQFRSEEAIRKLHTRANDGMVLVQSLEEETQRVSAYKLARVTVAVEGEVSEAMLLLDRPLHVLLVASSTPDPSHPGRCLVETGPNILTVDQFKMGARA